MKGFYLDLPSNSSLNYYANNKPSKFTTRFNKPLELEGEWEMALVEMSYPAFKSNEIYQKGLHIEYVVEQPLKPGQTVDNPDYEFYRYPLQYIKYADFIEKFVKGFNEWSKREIGQGCVTFHLDQNDYLHVNIPPSKYNTRQHISIPSFIAKAFQFPSAIESKGYTYIGESMNALGPYKSMFERTSLQVFLYADCIAHENVGDASAQLLRTFALYPNAYQRNFQHLLYKPVTKTFIESLEINIRNEIGEYVSFDKEILNLTLHFRKNA